MTRFARAPAQAKTAPRVRQARESARARPRAEALADAAASAVLGGRTNVAREVGHAPAASASVAGSPGTPLAPALRSRLERGFGADLSAVRVHTDASAAHAARAEHAHAFAAGPHVYLDLPAHALNGEAGLRLLAHEVAHVLQQTGQRDGDGRLRATEMNGVADVQCESDLAAIADGKNLFAKSPPGWEELVKVHGGAKALGAHLTKLDAIIARTTPVTGKALKDLGALANDGTVKALPAATRAFYVDAMKWAGAFDAARALLLADVKLETAFRSRAFYEHVFDKGLDWLGPLALAHPFLGKYFPDRYVAAYRSVFYGPGRPIQDLDPQVGGAAAGAKPFAAKLSARLESLAAASGTSENELAALALCAARELDSARQVWHERELAVLRRPDPKQPERTLPQTHRALASLYKDSPVTDPILVPSVYPEAAPLHARAAERIKATATEAVAYWDKILDALNAANTGKVQGAFHAADAKSRLEAIGSNPRFAKLGPTLAAAGAKVLRRKDKQLPDAATFASNVRAAQRQLNSHSTIYTASLANLAAKGMPDTPDAIAIGLVLWRIGDLELVLQGHAQRTAETGGDRKRRDARVATQILFARRLEHIGHQMKVAAATKAADEFLAEGYHLALLSEWEPVPNYGLKEFRDSIEHHKAEEELYVYEPPAGITWAVFRDFISAREFEVIADTLSAVQPVAGTPALAGARKKAEEAYRPRSFVIREHEWADPSLSSKPPAAALGNPFSQELNANPLTVALKKKELHWNEIATESIGYPGTKPIHMSFLPGMDHLMKAVHDRVGPQVEAAWQAKHPGAPALRPEDWNGYLKALRVYVEADKITHVAQVRAAMGSHLSAQRDRAYRAGRKLASHDRHVAAAALRTLWARFVRSNPTTWDFGRQARWVIERFGRSVWPDEDRLMQVTTLVLETTAEMDESFGSYAQYGDDVVTDWVWGLLSGALDTWDSRKATWTGRLPADDIVEMHGIPQAEVQTRVADLRALHEAIAKRTEPRQRTQGFVADATAGAERIHYVGWGYAVKKGEAFEGRDAIYLLVDVHRSFTYHPPLAEFTDLGLKWPRSVPGDDLVLDHGGQAIPRDLDLVTILRLDKGGKGSETKTIKGSDRGELYRVYRAVDWFTFFRHMENTGAVVTAIAQIAIEIAELFPGVGQGIMLARFVTGVLDTLTKPEFRRMLDLVGKEGLGAIGDIFEELLKYLDPVELLEVLLFEADFRVKDNEKVKNEKTANQFLPMAGQTKTSLWQRVARMLKNIAQLGLRVLEALKRLTRKAQVPVRTAQMWVLSHPKAAMLLDLLSMGLDLVASMTIDQIAMMLESAEKGWKELLKSSLNEAAQELVKQGLAIINTLGRFELPREIVPVELIVDFFVEMAVKAAGGGKLGLLVKSAKAALEKVGLWDRVITFISDRIRVNNLDPNQFYRKEVKDRIQPLINDTRTDFMNSLLGTLRDIPVLGSLTDPSGTPLPLDDSNFTTSDFPESNPAASTPPAVRRDVALPAPSGGTPLAPSTRRTTEQTWGHDLSHVRVHTGPDAARVTGAFGAEGLTTGSHVYLRPGLTPGSANGASVLRHELAHVIQQTGPRPLGGAHGSTPSAGGAGRGLVWDGGREAEADRASRADGPGPSSFGGGGAQPLMARKFIKKFLDDLGGSRPLETARDEIERKAKSLGGVTTRSTATALKQAIDKLPAKEFQRPFGTIREPLLRLNNALWRRVEAAFPILEDLSREVVTPPEGAETSTSQPFISPTKLQLEIRRFLYALTGMAFDLELASEEVTIHGKVVRRAATVNPIKKLSMEYFHVPFPEPGPAIEEIWDLLVKTSFTGQAGYDATTHPMFKIATKMVLGKGARPDTYESAEFKLKKGRIAVIVKQVGAISKIADLLRTGGVRWPSPSDYANPSNAGFEGALKDLGLRVGTYGGWDWEKVGELDRDPHHITQFLLVEYFHNEKTSTADIHPRPFPFKTDGVKYPGVAGAGSSVDTIAGSPGTIHVDKLFAGDRGATMPVIMIARPAHQGGLHYKQSRQVVKPKTARRKEVLTPSGQGWTVHNTFNEALKKSSEPVSDALKSEAQVKALGKQKDETKAPSGVAVTPQEVKTAIVTAARETYKALQNEMNPILKEALTQNETRYYNMMAQHLLGTSAARLTTMDVERPYNKALEDNKKVIETDGGFQ